MKKNNRKQIDIFLVVLDEFLQKYHSETDDIYDVEKVFIPIFKANGWTRTSIAPSKIWLQVPYIVMLSNRTKMSFVSENDKQILRNRFERARTSTYIQWVAYKLNYKLVKDVSYEHIFMKMLLNNSEKAQILLANKSNTHQDKLKEYDLKEFLIPEDFFHNDDLIIY